MKRDFRFLALSLVFVLVFVALAGCGTTQKPENGQEQGEQQGEAAAEPITLVYAEVNPIDSIVGKTAVAFKEKVEELSNGQILIDIQASGVLGAENDVLDTMLGGGGTIDMARISAFSLTSYGGENQCCFPFLLHLQAAIISELCRF